MTANQLIQLGALRHDYLDQPYEVSLETLTRCNAACSFCPYPTLERKGSKMPTELLYRLADEMEEWKPFYLSPFKVNEPLLDHRLLNFCELINRQVPQAHIRLFTNGSPLTREKIFHINKLHNIEHLWISLNSHLPGEYHALMQLDFWKTAAKIDLLHGMYRSGEFKHPVVLSKVSRDPQNESEFLGFCVQRWPFFRVHIIKQDGWLGYVPPADPSIPNLPCWRWFELSILSTGVVSLCCMDGTGQFQIGNINTDTMLEVYNAPHWRNRRLDMISRRTIHPCSTCTY